MTQAYKVDAPVDSGESYGTINAFLTDTIANESSGATKLVGRVFKDKTVDGEVVLGPHGHKQRDSKEKHQKKNQPLLRLPLGIWALSLSPNGQSA